MEGMNWRYMVVSVEHLPEAPTVSIASNHNVIVGHSKMQLNLDWPY